MNIMEYYCAVRKDYVMNRDTWKDLYELMENAVNRAKKIIYTVTERLSN